MAQAQTDDKDETTMDDHIDKIIVMIEKSVARGIDKEQIIKFLAKKEMSPADIDKAFEQYEEKIVCNKNYSL